MISEYKLSLNADDATDKLFHTLRHDTTIEVEAVELGTGLRRQFKLHPYTIDRMSGILTVTVQCDTGEWATIVVEDEVKLQVVD